MKNFISDGKTIDYTVADSAIKGGDIRMVGEVAIVAITSGDVNDTIAAKVEGVYELPKGTGALTQGQKVYVNVTDGVTTIVGTATGNKLAGYAWEAAASADTTVLVKINA